MSLGYTKEIIDWRNSAFGYEKEDSYGIENRNDMTRINNN